MQPLSAQMFASMMSRETVSISRFGCDLGEVTVGCADEA